MTDLYYDDERGDLPLKTKQVIQSNYSGPDASLVTKNEDYFYTESNKIGINHCYANPVNCLDGLSIGFWFKG